MQQFVAAQNFKDASATFYGSFWLTFVSSQHTQTQEHRHMSTNRTIKLVRYNGNVVDAIDIYASHADAVAAVASWVRRGEYRSATVTEHDGTESIVDAAISAPHGYRVVTMA